MKKKSIILIIVMLIVIFISFMIFKVYKNRKDNTLDGKVKYDEGIEQPTDSKEDIDLQLQVQEKINNMSLKEKIGQMLVISYSGNQYTDSLDKMLNDVKPGGFILFKDNISTYEATKEYILKIKSTADIPMTIGIDQEGGRVQRIKDMSDVNVLTIPSMYSLGKKGDANLSYNVGSVMAQELNAFGINLDYAPVLDIFSNPNNTVIGDRAFGNDAQTVINMALPFANGMKSKGIIPVYKHFPGHGDTDADSHIELPVVNKTKEELYQKEILPFKAAIEADADIIMVAHIALPKITGNYIPATLSSDIIDGILRKELGFKGVVVTDAINMKALSDNYTLEQICSYSINAGVDIILMPSDPISAVSTIEQLINNGTITEERINESVKRILLMKYNNKLDEQNELGIENIGTQEHIDIINTI